jgi:hypothetical protein
MVPTGPAPERAAVALPRRQETSVFKGLLAQRLLALAAAGVLLFNFPLLALWDRDVLVFGVPLFPAALFALWALLIGLLALLIEGADEDGDG